MDNAHSNRNTTRKRVRNNKPKDSVQGTSRAELLKRAAYSQKRWRHGLNGAKRTQYLKSEAIRKRKARKAKKDELDVIDKSTSDAHQLCKQRYASAVWQKDNEIKELKLRLSQIQNALSASLEAQHGSREAVSVAKCIWSGLSAEEKRKCRIRLRDLDTPGWNRAVRRELGVNLSNPEATDVVENNLENAVIQFLNEDDITRVSPDKKKTTDGQQQRFRLYHLYVLHRMFLETTGFGVSYSAFCAYVIIQYAGSDMQCGFCTISIGDLMLKYMRTLLWSLGARFVCY